MEWKKRRKTLYRKKKKKGTLKGEKSMWEIDNRSSKLCLPNKIQSITHFFLFYVSSLYVCEKGKLTTESSNVYGITKVSTRTKGRKVLDLFVVTRKDSIKDFCARRRFNEIQRDSRIRTKAWISTVESGSYLDFFFMEESYCWPFLASEILNLDFEKA